LFHRRIHTTDKITKKARPLQYQHQSYSYSPRDQVCASAVQVPGLHRSHEVTTELHTFTTPLGGNASNLCHSPNVHNHVLRIGPRDRSFDPDHTRTDSITHRCSTLVGDLNCNMFAYCDTGRGVQRRIGITTHCRWQHPSHHCNCKPPFTHTKGQLELVGADWSGAVAATTDVVKRGLPGTQFLERHRIKQWRAADEILPTTPGEEPGA
jgi:hypothetical protein